GSARTAALNPRANSNPVPGGAPWWTCCGRCRAYPLQTSAFRSSVSPTRRLQKKTVRGLEWPTLVLILFLFQGQDGERERARPGRLERLVPEPASPPEQEAKSVPPCEPARGRGRGGPPKSVAKSISTFKILRPDEVWQPRVGARPGNKNALK